MKGSWGDVLYLIIFPIQNEDIGRWVWPTCYLGLLPLSCLFHFSIHSLKSHSVVCVTQRKMPRLKSRSRTDARPRSTPATFSSAAWFITVELLMGVTKYLSPTRASHSLLPGKRESSRTDRATKGQPGTQGWITHTHYKVIQTRWNKGSNSQFVCCCNNKLRSGDVIQSLEY